METKEIVSELKQVEKMLAGGRIDGVASKPEDIINEVVNSIRYVRANIEDEDKIRKIARDEIRKEIMEAE